MTEAKSGSRELFERATDEDPEILPAIGRGDFKSYFAWVKPRMRMSPWRTPERS